MKLNKIIFQKKNSWLIFVSILAIGLFLPFAYVQADVLGQVIGKFFFYVLMSPFIGLFKLEMIILPIIAQFNNFTRLDGIVNSWTILRDLANIFFIVILLLMSFATILKIQSYGYKELLKNLIIMAILINFSKTIAGFMIDIGQVVMLTFVAAIKDVAAGNLTAIFGIDKMVSLSTDTDGGTGSGDIIMAYILGGVMMMLVSIVLMAFIVMLVMRIVYLWILVIVSPLAFLANTFPSTKKYFSEWFSRLGKEIIIGPVLIFFLWVSLTILANGAVTTELQKNTSQEQANLGQESIYGAEGQVGLTEAGKWDFVLNFIVALGMLVGSLAAAKSVGSSAMSYGAGAADKLKSYASKAYGGSAKFVAKRSWEGSTGEGGLKGGLQRAGTKLAAPTLMKAGSIPVVGGLLYRAGARVEGAEDQRKQRKQAKIEDRYKYVRDERKADVYAGRGGDYSKRALDKFNIEEGNLNDLDADEILKMKQRAKDINDRETVKKLKAKDARSYETTDKDGLNAKLDESGASAVRNIDPASLLENGNLTDGGSIVVNAVASRLTSEQIQTMLKGMTEQNAQVWRTALRQVGSTALTGSNGVLPRNDAGEVDKDSIAYRTATLDNDVYAAAIADQSLTREQRNRLSAARVANMSDRQVLNINPNSATWQNLASHFTEAQRNQVATNGTDAQVDALIQHGNLTDVLNNQNIQNRNRSRGANIAPQINANITNNITNMAPAEALDYRSRLANNNLPNAHLIMPSDQELITLINRLDVNRAQQIDGAVLRRVLPQLSAQMQTALAARGIGVGPQQQQQILGQNQQPINRNP